MVGIVAAFIVGLLVGSAGTASTGGPSAPAASSNDSPVLDSPVAPGSPRTYTLEVTTTGVSSIGNLMWNNGNGGMETRDGRSAPFRTDVTVAADRPYETVQVTAQLPLNGGSTDSITCTLREGDRVLDTQTSSGKYAVASCNSAGL